MKKAVKKGSAQAKEFAKRLADEKILECAQHVAYTQQAMIDTMVICLHHYYGFGPERQKKFADAFEDIYSKIKQLERDDTPDGEYYVEKVEEALKAACGPYYKPREERYDFRLITPDGGSIKL